MNDKIAIVTGASSGIGRAVAIDLAKHNYHVILVARSEDKLKAVKAEIEACGKLANYYAFDISDDQQVDACVNDLISKYNKIDFLFNNAGIFHVGTTELSNQQIKTMIAVNLLGTIFFSNAVAKQMKIQKSGMIINLASILGKTTAPNFGGYSASKSGVVAYGDALAQEMSLYNVKVTTLCPSIVNTKMVADFVNSTRIDPNTLIQPEDIVKTIRFLLQNSENVSIKEIIIDNSATVKQLIEN